jgi:hypothetical protein
MGTSIKLPKDNKTSAVWEARGRMEICSVSPPSKTGTRNVGRRGGAQFSITGKVCYKFCFCSAGGKKFAFQCQVMVYLSS